MYNIMIFDDKTMDFVIVYMSDNLTITLKMFDYYRKTYENTFIKIVQDICSNDYLLG